MNWTRDNTGWPILSFLKKWSIFVKSTYGSNYVVFSNISRNFRSRYHTVLTILSFQELYVSFDQKLFFLIQIFLKNTNQEQYGLIHNYPFTKIWPILSSSNQDTIQLKAYCPLKAPFFHFKTSLTIKSSRQYGLTHIVHLDQFNQSSSKMVCIVFANIFSKFRSGYNNIGTILFSQVSSIKFHKKLFCDSLKCFW